MLASIFIQVNRCRATVIQSGDGEFVQGPQPHNHPGQVGAGLTARITARAKREAMADIFKQATAIVNKVLLEELTDDPCPSLRKTYRQLQSKIFILWDRYENGEKSVEQLLRACSHLYGPRDE